MKLIHTDRYNLPTFGLVFYKTGQQYGIRMPWLWPLSRHANDLQFHPYILVPGFLFAVIFPYRKDTGWSHLVNRFGESYGRRQWIARISFSFFSHYSRWFVCHFETLRRPIGEQKVYEDMWGAPHRGEDCQ